MKKLPALALILACGLSLLLISSCSDAFYITPEMTFAYDDFGPEPMASSLLGPKGKDTQVVTRFASTRTTPPAEGPDIRFVNLEQAMNYLRRCVRRLPKTGESSEVRQRLSRTYARLYYIYSAKRNSLMAAPSSSYGRGGMNRAQMMPPMPPNI